MGGQGLAQLALVPIIRQGDLLESGETVLELLPSVADSQGTLVAYTRVHDGLDAEWSFVQFEGNRNSLIIKRGQQVPGFPANTYFDFSLRPNAIGLGPGAVVISTLIEGPFVDDDERQTFWRWQNDELQLLAQESNPAHELGPDITFREVPEDLRLPGSPDGSVIFSAWIQGPGVGGGNSFTLWYAPPGNDPILLLRSGVDGSAGVPSGSPQNTVYSLNDRGEILLAGNIAHLPGSDGLAGIWRGLPGKFVKWIGEGAEIIDHPGFTLGPFGPDPRLPLWTRDGSKIVVNAIINGAEPGEDIAIVKVTDDGAEILARMGDTPPGIPGTWFIRLRSLAFAETGELVFTADLRGQGVNGLNEHTAWHRAADGTMTKILRSDEDVPQLPGFRYRSFDTVLIDDKGLVFINTQIINFRDQIFNALLVFDPVTNDTFPLLVQGDLFDTGDELVEITWAFVPLKRPFGGATSWADTPHPVLSVTWPGGNNSNRGFFHLRWPPCAADLTESASPNHPYRGFPDGVVDAEDFFFYLDGFAVDDLRVCDLDDDGDCDADDFFAYLDLFSMGCP